MSTYLSAKSFFKSAVKIQSPFSFSSSTLWMVKTSLNISEILVIPTTQENRCYTSDFFVKECLTAKSVPILLHWAKCNSRTPYDPKQLLSTYSTSGAERSQTVTDLLSPLGTNTETKARPQTVSSNLGLDKSWTMETSSKCFFFFFLNHTSVNFVFSNISNHKGNTINNWRVLCTLIEYVYNTKVR